MPKDYPTAAEEIAERIEVLLQQAARSDKDAEESRLEAYRSAERAHHYRTLAEQYAALAPDR